MLRIIDIFLGITILILGEIYFSKKVLERKNILNKKTIIIIILTAIISTISFFNTNGILKTIISIIIRTIMLKEIYNISLSKSLFLTLICTIIMLIPDIIQLIVITNFISMSKEYFYGTYSNCIIANLIVCIGIITITNITKKYIKKLLEYEIEMNYKISILSILTLLSVIVVFFKSFSEIKFNDSFIVGLIIIGIFISVLINLMKQMVENSKITAEYDRLLDFMKTYEEEIEEQRTLRHETKNQLLTIKAKICDKEEEDKVIKYIDSILNEKIEVKQEKYAKFQYLPANGIKALFYFKTQEAESKNIDVSINIGKTVENSLLYKLSTEDFKQLGRILGVYLDNAIEASESSKYRIMGLEVYLIDNKVKVIISNSYDKQEIENISENGLSNKGKNRGHGLLLVKSIINSNNIFKQETEITEKLYVQKLEIKSRI